MAIDDYNINQLIKIESEVNYTTPPPLDRQPFIVYKRNSKVLISAPHGTLSYRNNLKEKWHEEDEYTAGMAILLGELTGASVIANIWLSPDSDPNFHFENRCLYKQKIREVVNEKNIKYVIDLHGAKSDNEKMKDNFIDIGTRNDKSLKTKNIESLQNTINEKFKTTVVSKNVFSASEKNAHMSITAFCDEILKIEAVQIEMKPIVRVPLQKLTSSALSKGIIHEVNKVYVKYMLESLVIFIKYLK